jgi:hypothetical protein
MFNICKKLFFSAIITVFQLLEKINGKISEMIMFKSHLTSFYSEILVLQIGYKFHRIQSVNSQIIQRTEINILILCLQFNGIAFNRISTLF